MGKSTGSGCKTGKLTKEQIEWYRERMYTMTLKEAAKCLPVSAQQLCRIRSGQNWAN